MWRVWNDGRVSRLLPKGDPSTDAHFFTPPPWWDPPYPPPYYAAYKLHIPQMLPVIMTPLSGTSHTPQILPMNVFLVSSNR